MIEKRFPPTHHYYVPLHICLYAGLRIGEALGLQWEDIDLKNQELSVRGTMMENGVWQDVPKTKSSFRRREAAGNSQGRAEASGSRPAEF